MRWLEPTIIKRIIQLLGGTDISMPLIAKRFNLSKDTIRRINEEYQIRTYISRDEWTVNSTAHETSDRA